MVRIATQDAESATLLVQFLLGSGEAERVWLDPSSGEVCVDDRGQSKQIRRVLAGIECWLAEAGIGAVRVSVDGRAYRMERRARLDLTLSSEIGEVAPA
jgi:hypothetical protein